MKIIPTIISMIISFRYNIFGNIIYDIINRIKERCPTAIDLWPTPVQGVSAAQLIIEAIKGSLPSRTLKVALSMAMKPAGFAEAPAAPNK